jgi:hypothetical protein
MIARRESVDYLLMFKGNGLVMFRQKILHRMEVLAREMDGLDTQPGEVVSILGTDEPETR